MKGLFRLGIGMAAAGLVWSAWPQQDADPSYVPRGIPPTFSRPAPRVLIDEAHFNVHTADGRFAPFARLLRHDGYRVAANDASFEADRLTPASILVVANALGLRGLIQQAVTVAGGERSLTLPVGAFADSEVAEVKQWVERGGNLLLIADHAPSGAAAASLAAAFGVEMRSGWAEDPGHADPQTANPGFLVFSRDNGLLPSSPIVEGRTRSERVQVVMTFTGQALSVPRGAVAVLPLADTARDYPFRRSRESEGRSAAGLAQLVALRAGRGRVVVAGEAAMFTAQQTVAPDGTRIRFGMNRDGIDNEQFVLNIMHWLSGLLPGV